MLFAPVKLIVVSELGTVDPTVTTAVVERAEEIRWLGAYAFRRELPTAGVDLILIDVDHGLEDAADLTARLAAAPAPPAAAAPRPESPPEEPPPPPAETSAPRPTGPAAPRPRIAFLATTLTSRIRATARACGVDALLSKSLTVDELTTALVSAAAGARVDAPGRPADATSWPGQAEGLTQREGEVLELCAAGFTNREIAELFRAAPSDSEVTAMLRTGAVHHRLGLTPQWYLASFVHVVCDHLPMLFAGSPSPRAAVDAASALLSRVLFDASLGLDAFELSVERELLTATPRPARTPATTPAAPAPPPATGAPPGTPEWARTVTRITVISDEAQVRRDFVGIDDDVRAVLQRLAPAVEQSIPGMLDDFYDVLSTVPAVAELVPPDVVPRLLITVAEHWRHLIHSPFDRAQAEACVGVGLVHERIGLSPQLYLAGLAHQVSGLLRDLAARSGGEGTVDGADLLPLTDALIRASFFDLTFVLDAYLDARIDTLLDGQRFASQIVANLATGVAVVDARGRIEYVNEQLLVYMRQPTRTLRRLPLEHAFDLDGLNELVSAARTSISGRASIMARHRDRRLRVTAACLHRTVTGDPGPVAIVVDDVTEVVRVGTGGELDDRHLLNVLAAVSSIAWEIDQESLVMVAMSRTLESLTGHRDIDLLGGDAWPAVLDAGDGHGSAAALSSAVRSLREGQRTEVDHKVHTVDGRLIAARSSLVAGTGATGRPTVFGVTVAIPDGSPGA